MRLWKRFRLHLACPSVSSVQWPEIHPFPDMIVRLRVHYELRAARWMTPCQKCTRDAHPIAESGFWYWCPKCLRTFEGEDHEFYYDWQIFLSFEEQGLLRNFFYGRPSPAVWWYSRATGPRSEEDPTTLADFCFATIVSVPGIRLRSIGNETRTDPIALKASL